MKNALVLLFFVSLPSVAQDFSEFNGVWRGQSQFQATIRSKIDPSAHAVTNMAITIDPMGKIVGVSDGNGCKLSVLCSSCTMIINNQLHVLCVTLGLNQRFNFFIHSSTYFSLPRRGVMIAYS